MKSFSCTFKVEYNAELRWCYIFQGSLVKKGLDLVVKVARHTLSWGCPCGLWGSSDWIHHCTTTYTHALLFTGVVISVSLATTIAE